MREIKFRSWDSEFKECLYFTLNEILQPEVKPYFIRNNVIEQFTGLKDKNGKEIYEGDILTEGKVYFSDDYLGYFVGDDREPLYDISIPKIIGNIHEVNNAL